MEIVQHQQNDRVLPPPFWVRDLRQQSVGSLSLPFAMGGVFRPIEAVFAARWEAVTADGRLRGVVVPVALDRR